METLPEGVRVFCPSLAGEVPMLELGNAIYGTMLVHRKYGKVPVLTRMVVGRDRYKILVLMLQI